MKTEGGGGGRQHVLHIAIPPATGMLYGPHPRPQQTAGPQPTTARGAAVRGGDDGERCEDRSGGGGRVEALMGVTLRPLLLRSEASEAGRWIK